MAVGTSPRAKRMLVQYWSGSAWTNLADSDGLSRVLSLSIHDEINTPYPVMYLDDIEIHWIHENDKNTLLEKYYRRIERYKTENPNPLFLLCASDLCNDHTDEE